MAGNVTRARRYIPPAGDGLCPPPTAPGAIVVGTFPLESGEWIAPHAHTHHQLAWTRGGVLGVGIGDAYWVLPPTRALWIPAGTRHSTGATRGALLHGLYFPPERCAIDWPDPTPVVVDGLLAHLIVHLSRDDLPEDARLRAEAVAVDLLRPLPTTPIDVPYPVDDRVRAVADALLTDPADPRGLEVHARAIGVSRRTLTRLFTSDTGMTFDHWRTHARLRAALPLLAEGHPVSRVARTVGYATPSSFLAAFRRTVGTSPGRYLGTMTEEPGRGE
ncbi:helix-turn-helix domain-containing protein [Streptomyces sp. SID4919]|uniref:helix-turn-helix transcriptional regulator n=1 Tax=unclassified Streptomyces TaxID=2593676 RepID=UPI000823F550|nr:MULTISPECIES: helix-turn-helix transcriptional regulator [unclassified Streptomyces]MYY09072.1 helix-turn-helix domain-containing protein [Streptomyces sp. SID4919]SCK28527.1 AraC-type DNA-binding protein [Streptomyces sp. AmelKG-E11A]